jgi:hypothetical protein
MIMADSDIRHPLLAEFVERCNQPHLSKIEHLKKRVRKVHGKIQTLLQGIVLLKGRVK